MCTNFTTDVIWMNKMFAVSLANHIVYIYIYIYITKEIPVTRKNKMSVTT